MAADEAAASVLVVDDDAALARALAINLTAHGYRVTVAQTGRQALIDVAHVHPDVVVLDLGLPDLDGLEVLAGIRGWSTVPVIVLSARATSGEKVLALDAGADDYVTKPFSSRELVARIRAVLRRRNDAGELVPAVVEAGPVRLDVDRHVVTVRGQTVSLPLKEFELLELLLRNSSRVLTRGQLIDRVWGSDYVGDTKTLDVHVKRLRAKVESDPSAPRHLVTVRGLGYKFEA